MKSRFFLLPVAMTVLISGCSSAPKRPAISEESNTRDYYAERAKLERSDIISPGFGLRIHNSADEQITGEYFVSFRGDLKLPYDVKVSCAGLTPSELAEKVAKAYAPYFKTRPSVKVEIVSRDRLIEVRGMVHKPGIYPVKSDTSLEEALAAAGGLGSPTGDSTDSDSRPQYIRIVSRNPAQPDAPPKVRWIRLSDYFSRYDIHNEVLWRGGEQLFVQMTGDPSALAASSQTFQLLGEVHKPGEYPVQGNVDLYTYLAQAGGPTATADMEKVIVIHKASNDSDSYDLSRSTQYAKIEPGDVVVVKSTQLKATFFERFGPLIISIGGLAISVTALIIAI